MVKGKEKYFDAVLHVILILSDVNQRQRPREEVIKGYHMDRPLSLQISLKNPGLSTD